jgi:hypothetical protein
MSVTRCGVQHSTRVEYLNDAVSEGMAQAFLKEVTPEKANLVRLFPPIHADHQTIINILKVQGGSLIPHPVFHKDSRLHTMLFIHISWLSAARQGHEVSESSNFSICCCLRCASILEMNCLV